MQVTLKIYQAKSAQWAGVFYGLPANGVDGVGVELGRVAGCSSPNEVLEAVSEMYSIGIVDRVSVL